VTISRRTFIAAAVAATGAGGLATYALSGRETPPSTPQRLPAPLQSDILRRSFGINTHVTRTESPYAATPDAGGAVVELIRRLGASYWRERAAVEDPLQRRIARELAGIDCRQVATIGELGDSQGSISSTLRVLAGTYGSELPSVVAAIAGVNEPNASGADWVRASVRHQRTVFEQARRTTAFNGIPVLASAVQGNLDTSVLDMRALARTDNHRWADFGNMHHYPAGQVPTLGLDERLAAARSVVAGRQAWCTEIGYVDWLGHGPGNPVPEMVYAAYMPRALLEMVRRGVPAMIKYELLDQSNRSTSWEGHFGLVRCPSSDPKTWVEKPAYDVLRRLLDLTSDVGPVSPPARLVGTVTSGVSVMLLGKRDGTYILLLWRDVSLYDVTSKEIIADSPVPVTVSLTRRHPLSWGPLNAQQPSRQELLHEITIPVGGNVVALTVGLPGD
jgi:hypothetical protein